MEKQKKMFFRQCHVCIRVELCTTVATELLPPSLDMDRVKRLLAENAPELYMHPADRFMPCSVEWFMNHSELWLTAPSAEV